MHVHLPKPLHGWREFAGEVGIIVLGVLIALGAEQLVEAVHWHNQVHETRDAIDAELSHDLAVLHYRLDARDCVGRRLDELDRWSRDIGNGKPLPLRKTIDPPISFVVRTAVWDSTSGEVASRMPLQAKLHYASLYATLKTFQGLLEEEGTQWTTLQSYEENRDLDRRELHEVRAAILSLQADNEIVGAFEIRAAEFADDLRLKPEADVAGKLKQRMADMRARTCAPLL